MNSIDHLPTVKVSNTIIFRVEEIPALACPNLPGIWVTVAGLGEGGKEAPILVGILSCDQDLEDSTFEETLSEVVMKARKLEEEEERKSRVRSQQRGAVRLPG